MRTNDTLLKLQRFEANEKQQKVRDIELMIADFKHLADDLMHQIQIEEENSRIRDVNHFSYPPFAKAARERRQNLFESIEALEGKLEEARAELAEATEELRKAEMVQERSINEQERLPRKTQPGELVSPDKPTQLFVPRN
ncbi:MAG: flagellar export protein FliJ [Hyphomicrobiales bacterium]|nr:flagellar export protein FliJ [Hyphomicrobiales bacterium]